MWAAVEVFLDSVQTGWEPNTEGGEFEATQRHRVAKLSFHITPQVSGRTRPMGIQTNAMSSANFLYLDRKIMRSRNSYRAASCGCSTSHKMIIYFLWASVWSESSLLSLCGRNKQGLFCFYLVLTLRQSRESEEGSRSSLYVYSGFLC